MEKSKSQATSIYIEKALELFDQGYACAQSIVLAFSDEFDLDRKQAALISSNFGGGMGRLRRTCGALTGAFMILGFKFGNSNADDFQTKIASYQLVQEITAKFEKIHGTSMCEDLIYTHASEEQVIKREHHRLICRKVIADAVELLEEMLKQDNSL